MKKNLDSEMNSIDEAAIERIRFLEKQSQLPLLAQLVEVFFEDATELIQKIHSGFGANDLRTVRTAAHTLKSSAANLGAVRLRDLAEKIEAAKELTPEINQLIDPLTAELRTTLKTLKSLI